MRTRKIASKRICIISKTREILLSCVRQENIELKSRKKLDFIRKIPNFGYENFNIGKREYTRFQYMI